MAALHPEMVCRHLEGSQVMIMSADPLWALQITLDLSHCLPAALNSFQFHSPELPALGSHRGELQSPIPFRQWDQVLAAVEVRLKFFITWIFRLPTMSAKKKGEKPTTPSKLPPVHS